MQEKPRGRGGRNTVRIIGGTWRGRRLHFPDAAGLRPTPDRVRETLFNWLQPALPGAHCLDLFAGSGALGLEALSRGAASALLVEQQPEAVRGLRAAVAMLGAAGAEVVQADALAWLAGPARPCDVAFVDPPYAAQLLPAVLARLAGGGWLRPGAWVYLEAPAADGPPALPAAWSLHRSGRAGEVGYHLARVPAAPGVDAGTDP